MDRALKEAWLSWLRIFVPRQSLIKLHLGLENNLASSSERNLNRESRNPR